MKQTADTIRRSGVVSSNAMRARLVCLLFLLSCCALAIDLKSLKPQGYVSDFAEVVDADSRAAIEEYAAAVEKTTGAQMSFVTLKTLGGDPLENVSIDLFRQFGVGQKNKDNGVQLLLVIDDHQSRLEVGNGLEAVLPDGLDGQILLDIRPELRASHYGRALLIAAQRIGQTIAASQGKTVTATPAVRDAPPHSHDDGFPWPMLVFVGLFILMAVLRGRSGGGGGGFLTGMILGNLMGGGWGRGGGFGGFNGGGSSSGGFGGFGGGDAGGGGASSSW